MKNKILIVDDEQDIVTMLKRYFEKEQYEVMIAMNGKEAITLAEKNPDIILLDINMPEHDGFAVCKHIRNYVSCPILFLTAKTTDADKVKGFSVGGDDYIIKPFSIVELGARVQAHLRRELRHNFDSNVKFKGGLIIDYYAHCVSFEDTILTLTKREFDIIEVLSEHPGQIFDKERIYEQIWGYDSNGDSSVVVEHIRRIRGKLKEVGCEQYIETIWGSGYKWIK